MFFPFDGPLSLSLSCHSPLQPEIPPPPNPHPSDHQNLPLPVLPLLLLLSSLLLAVWQRHQVRRQTQPYPHPRLPPSRSDRKSGRPKLAGRARAVPAGRDAGLSEESGVRIRSILLLLPSFSLSLLADARGWGAGETDKADGSLLCLAHRSIRNGSSTSIRR
jgi:hypothetical protein